MKRALRREHPTDAERLRRCPEDSADAELRGLTSRIGAASSAHFFWLVRRSRVRVMGIAPRRSPRPLHLPAHVRALDAAVGGRRRLKAMRLQLSQA